ncbi:hypothetical protein [Actinomadura sediminis]|uniref:DUF3592 domain-containing protein n=1 Tax=Actinomadura sediminis TaxID=1038904 RepID=A0ABW3EJK4_9ACTN
MSPRSGSPHSAAAQSGAGSVVIRLRPFRMAGQRGGLPVLVHAGEQVLRLAPGDNPLPLPPGVWPVRVWCSYFGIKVGKAETTVDTRAGGTVLLHYAPPHTIYSGGALAYEPVERPGRSVLVGIFVGAFALVVAMVLLGMLLA